MSNLYIIGGHSTALEIRELAEMHYADRFQKIFNVVPNDYIGENSNFIKDKDLLDTYNEFPGNYILGFSNWGVREKMKKIFEGLCAQEINIIHPKAYISNSAVIGIGNYIAANSVISTGAIVGNSNMINFNVVIGHDAHIGNNCVINPGARISGGVQIGNKCLLGANSVIFQNVEVGDDCIIDAMTYIEKNIKSRSICSSLKGSTKVLKRVI